MYNFNKTEKKFIDFTHIKPYGDTLDDAKIQVSFTLPLPPGSRSTQAALQLAEKMGLVDVDIVYKQGMGEFTYFNLYGKLIHSVDYTEILEVSAPTVLNRDQIGKCIHQTLKRKMVVVGATVGTDAHTVGLDSILNRKGFGGVPGLESYEMLDVHNLGGQVPVDTLISAVKTLNADAVLVSQTVTQKNIHITTLKQLREKLNTLPTTPIVVCGGSRITHSMAVELGYDEGFGKNTFPDEVINFLVRKLVDKYEQHRARVN